MKFDKLINEIKTQYVKYAPLDKDSEVVFDNDKIKIIQIYTEAGLKKYAQHTKWLDSSGWSSFDSFNYIKRLEHNQHLGWNLFVLINKELVRTPTAKIIFYVTENELIGSNLIYDSSNTEIDYKKEINKLLVDNNVDKELLGIFDETSHDDVLSKIEKKVPLNQILQNEHADMIFQTDDELQMLAIDNYKNAVKLIAAPSVTVQLYAVRKDGMNMIPLIQNKVKLVYEVELAAVQQNGMVLQYIPEPISPDVLMAAVKQNGHVIGVIIDRDLPVKDTFMTSLMIAAVTESGSAIESIIDAGVMPTPNLIEIAIANKHNPISVQEVNKLIKNLQKHEIKNVKL